MASIAQRSEFTIRKQYKTDTRGPVRWVGIYALRNWWLIIIAMAGAAGNAIFAALMPILIGQALNALVAVATQLARVGQIALLMVGIAVLRGVFQWGRNFGFELIAQRVERDVRDELYISLLGKSMTFHSLQPVGDTMARSINDVREINFLFNPGLNLVLGSFYFLILPIVIAPRYNPVLIITPILFLITYIIALWRYLRALSPITDEVRKSFGILNTRLAEALDGIETVKGASQEASEVKRFESNARRYRNAVVRQGDVEARFLPMLLFNISLAIGLMQALILLKQGTLNIGQVVGYFGVLLMLDFPTFASIWAYSLISSGIAGARRILELINRVNDLDQNIGGYSGPMKGEIEFQDVNFAYGENESSLCDVNLHIQPGQTVAVVGQTGSGKSSLTRLINRTFDVAAGKVLVDGIDTREWNLESLRRNISMIEQDVFLFSDTIEANISFGRPGATYQEIEAAAKAAQAHDFIMSFNDGYKTVVGDRGVTLSGGQRQRIALARAFLTDPRILILDDSTSAIDSATEDKIQRAIFTAARGRTTFIITHRLSQIRWADVIVVLRSGNIEAVGTHDELMQSSPAYQKIFSE